MIPASKTKGKRSPRPCIRRKPSSQGLLVCPAVRRPPAVLLTLGRPGSAPSPSQVKPPNAIPSYNPNTGTGLPLSPGVPRAATARKLCKISNGPAQLPLCSGRRGSSSGGFPEPAPGPQMGEVPLPLACTEKTRPGLRNPTVPWPFLGRTVLPLPITQVTTAPPQAPPVGKKVRRQGIKSGPRSRRPGSLPPSRRFGPGPASSNPFMSPPSGGQRAMIPRPWGSLTISNETWQGPGSPRTRPSSQGPRFKRGSTRPERKERPSQGRGGTGRQERGFRRWWARTKARPLVSGAAQRPGHGKVQGRPLPAPRPPGFQERPGRSSSPRDWAEKRPAPEPDQSVGTPIKRCEAGTAASPLPKTSRRQFSGRTEGTTGIHAGTIQAKWIPGSAAASSPACREMTKPFYFRNKSSADYLPGPETTSARKSSPSGHLGPPGPCRRSRNSRFRAGMTVPWLSSPGVAAAWPAAGCPIFLSAASDVCRSLQQKRPIHRGQGPSRLRRYLPSVPPQYRGHAKNLVNFSLKQPLERA
ncbi:hypothetical protein FQR65_LT20933 [Abscondita terminalis]|nr:hypothetical protein FQR65_LT20933 [Abscondita terminalis]